MEKIEITTATIASLRLEAGQKEQKIHSSAQIFATTPENGTFHHPGVKEFTLPADADTPERKVKSLGYFTGEDETTASFISENSIFARTITEEPVQIKSGPRAKKWMLKQQEISPKLRSLGNSQDLRMVALCGKSFTTKPVNGKTFKREVFIPTNVDKMMFAESKDDAVRFIPANLEPKTFHEFEVK